MGNMRKIKKTWIASLLSILAVAVFGAVVYSGSVIIDNVVQIEEMYKCPFDDDIRATSSSSNQIILPTAGIVKVKLDAAYTAGRDSLGLSQPESVLFCYNVHEHIGEIWQVGPYSASTELVFYIFKPYSDPWPGPYYSTDSAHCRVEEIAPGSWKLYFEDWIDMDYNDVIVTVTVVPAVDYIKVFPDPAYVCVSGEQQFIAKGYGYGENGERDGGPDPETYAPAGDDTGPESIEVTWVTSVAEEVGTIDEIGGLFTAGTTPGSGTVTAIYEREGDGPLTDSAEITVIGVGISHIPNIPLNADPPGKTVSVTPTITPNTAEVRSKITFKTSDAAKATVSYNSASNKLTIIGVSKSAVLDDIEVWAEIGGKICSNTVSLTVFEFVVDQKHNVSKTIFSMARGSGSVWVPSTPSKKTIHCYAEVVGFLPGFACVVERSDGNFNLQTDPIGAYAGSVETDFSFCHTYDLCCQNERAGWWRVIVFTRSSLLTRVSLLGGKQFRKRVSNRHFGDGYTPKQGELTDSARVTLTVGEEWTFLSRGAPWANKSMGPAHGNAKVATSLFRINLSNIGYGE